MHLLATLACGWLFVAVRASPETGIVTVEVQQQHDHVRIPSTSFASSDSPSVFNSGQAPGRAPSAVPHAVQFRRITTKSSSQIYFFSHKYPSPLKKKKILLFTPPLFS
jgi:hypothetical protein